MLSVEFWVGFALLLVIVLATTANTSMRHFSRVRLQEELERRGRPALFARLIDNQVALLFCSSLLRICCILALVLLIEHVFQQTPAGAMLGKGYASLVHYFVTFVGALFLVMIFGVAIPNAWARYDADRFLAIALPTLVVLQKILLPLVSLQHAVNWIARRLAGIPDDSDVQDEAEEIEKEILGVVSEGEATGAVHEKYASMIERIMDFRDKTVGQIMTPRTDIVAIPSNATQEEAKDLITREGHSRIPVYEENIDDIKGVLYAKDLLTLSDIDSFEPLEMMRKVPFVPESKPIPDLLQELREQKVHLAIVLDEYGGTAGLVTIEDIIEEIVGDIADEYEMPEPESIRRIDANTIEVDARVRIDEINEQLSTQLPEDEDYDTVGGFVFSALGKIPETGEELSYDNVKFRVIDAEQRRINRLRVQVIPHRTLA
ncbi:MAG: HlyC/CorC family transporter [Sedimentisphaerales bacterium]|nr:HlyC/CorC family transporter [Sedimentisphaerales bacterium]